MKLGTGLICSVGALFGMFVALYIHQYRFATLVAENEQTLNGEIHLLKIRYDALAEIAGREHGISFDEAREATK